MSEKFKIKIDSILGGISPSIYKGRKDQFATSIGIDPDLPIEPDSASIRKTGGVLTPTSYVDFSGAALTSYVNWLMTCPQNGNLYAYLANGRFLSYDTSFVETNITGSPLTGGAGNGGAYYNNYIYLAEDGDVSRYGPLDNSPVIVENVWTGATLGSKAALGNPTFPSAQGISYPNHPMHVHVDNKLYVGDFETAANANQGRGKVHFIKTERGTDEGDTNSGTTENAFYLPYSYVPIDIESWGNDLAVLAVPMHATGANATTVQGKAVLFLWDAINAPSLPYRVIPLIDPFASALLNHNGNLYIWSGNLNNGVRMSRYLGGYQTQQVVFFEEGYCPPAGCVDGMGNRVVWGAHTTYPENSSCVYAFGYKDANIPPALQNIMLTTHTTAAEGGSSRAVSALKYFQHASFAVPRLGVAWKDGAAVSENFGIDRYSANSAEVAVWRTITYSSGKPFSIKKVTFTLGETVSANTTIRVRIYVDDENSNTTIATINNTDFSGNRKITLTPQVQGNVNFFLEFRWSGSNSISVTLPIIIEGELLEDTTI